MVTLHNKLFSALLYQLYHPYSSPELTLHHAFNIAAYGIIVACIEHTMLLRANDGHECKTGKSYLATDDKLMFGFSLEGSLQ